MFKFTIETSNEAFEHGAAAGQLVIAAQAAAARMLDGETSGIIRDLNGNEVGKWSLQADVRVSDGNATHRVTMALSAVMRDDGWTEGDAWMDADSIAFAMLTKRMTLIESLREYFDRRSDDPEWHSSDIARRTVERLDEQATAQADDADEAQADADRSRRNVGLADDDPRREWRADEQ